MKAYLLQKAVEAAHTTNTLRGEMIMSAAKKLQSLQHKLTTGFETFFCKPASARPLAVLRIGIAAVLLMQAFWIVGSLQQLYGSHGLVQWSVLDPEQGNSPVPSAVPRIRWVAELLSGFGVSDAASVQLVFVVYVTSLSCMLLGWRTRTAAITAWLTHLAMNTAATASIYGVDQFANIALFYLAVMPAGAAFSLDVSSGRVKEEPSVEARIGLRVLQLHLCVVYLASGIEKASGIQWWNGEAIWRALMRPDLAVFDMSWLAAYPLIAKFLVWSTLALEIGYAFLVWPKLTRKFTAASTVALHVGIGVMMGLVSFAALMSVLSFSAWLVSAEPKTITADEPVKADDKKEEKAAVLVTA